MGNWPRLLGLAAIGLAGALSQAPVLAADWEKVRQQGLMQFVVVAKDREQDRAVYQEAIDALCQRGKRCHILFWSDRSLVPVRLPMSDRQRKAQVGSYTRNPSTGQDRLLLSCRFGGSPRECI